MPLRRRIDYKKINQKAFTSAKPYRINSSLQSKFFRYIFTVLPRSLFSKSARVVIVCDDCILVPSYLPLPTRFTAVNQWKHK